MKILISISVILIFNSCGSTDKGEATETESKVVECLRTSLSDYYNEEELILELLEEEGLLDESKESYAQLCIEMFSESIGHFEISEDDKKALIFIDTFGPHARIHQCTQQVKSDSVLTQNQIDFYTWFNDSAISGSMDTERLSDIITKMTDEEFNSAEVRETTLFICGHEIIRNHFFY